MRCMALWLALGLTAVATPISRPAFAEETLKCEVVEIIASTTDKPSIDGDLKDLEKKLRTGPFSAYNTFVKSARLARQAARLKAERYDTPKGAVEIVIRGLDRPAKKRPRLSLGVQLEDEAGKQYIDADMSVDAGDFLLFARPAGNKQTIVTALGCR
jgi:hypothetical protein